MIIINLIDFVWKIGVDSFKCWEDLKLVVLIQKKKLPNTSPNPYLSFVWKTWKISFWISFQFSFLHFFVVILFSITFFLYLWLHHMYIFFVFLIVWGLMFSSLHSFALFLCVARCNLHHLHFGFVLIACILVLSHLNDAHCFFILVLHQ